MDERERRAAEYSRLLDAEYDARAKLIAWTGVLVHAIEIGSVTARHHATLKERWDAYETAQRARQALR